jgi:predicted transcriptional regulator
MPVPRVKTRSVEGESSLPVARALACETRLLILSLLTDKVLNVSDIAKALALPHSTVNHNVNVLQSAGLVYVEYEPGTRGSQKLCSKRYDEILFKLPGTAVERESDAVETSMPVGSYRALSVAPTCGLASETKIIGMLDDPRSFYEPDHIFAQILWFARGWIEYAFPNNVPHGARATELQLAIEICSEAPQYDLDWPSDITVWINGVEIATWTCSSDFGGERGRLTPDWWPDDDTMYGVLKRWRVSETGGYVDGERRSSVRIGDLRLAESNHITLRIGVKPDARHQGGVNLFGRRFGNYAQDLVMRLRFAFD